MTYKVIFSAGVASLLCSQLYAEPSTQSFADIIVSATRWETSGVPVPASVSVITREEILQSGASNVTEVLNGQGGLQTQDLLGDGSRSVIDMRGFGSTGSANTLILIDGRRINNTDLASPRLNNIFIKDIERVEITRGSAAVLYGDQAVGGVVNIITRRPAEFEASVEAVLGSVDAQLQTVHVSNRFDNNIGIRFSGLRSRSDGYRDNSKNKYLNGFLSLDYDVERGRAFVDLQQTHEDLRLPGALSQAQLDADRKQTVFPLDFNNSINKAGRVGGQLALTRNWDFATELTYRDDDVDGVLTGLNIKQTRRQTSFHPRVRGRFDIAGQNATLLAGTDFLDTRYKLVSPFGTQFGDQELLSVYSLLTIPVSDTVSLSGGVRRAWHERELVDGFRFFPGDNLKDQETATKIGLSVKPMENVRLFLKREENYRFPLLDEEMNVFTLATLLETQTGVSYETGIEYTQPAWNVGITAYTMDIDDEINVDPNAFLENINLEETRHRGVIVDGSFSPLDGMQLGANYTFTDARITAGQFSDNRIPLVAKHQARLFVTQRILSALNLYADVFYISDRNAGGDFDGSNLRLKGYIVANLNLRYARNNLSVEARANNLLDKKYNGSASENFLGNVGYFPAPERNFFVTIGYNFQ